MSEIQAHAAEVVKLAVGTQIENVKFVSKKKLHSVQKEWNKLQRALRESLFAAQDEAAKLSDVTSGEFDPAELREFLDNHYGAKVSETRDAINEINAQRGEISNNDMIASEDQLRALDAVNAELQAYEDALDAIRGANDALLSEK